MLTSHGSSSHGSSSGTFTVRGQSVSGLYPGAVRDMALTLTNPYNFDLRVTGLTGKVASSSRRRCAPGRATVTTRAYSGQLPMTLRARTKRKVGSIPIAMAGSAPVSCSNTTFTVLLVGHATKAHR